MRRCTWGTPAVTTTAVGAAAGNLVRNQSNGLVVPERSPVALADAMRRLVVDPAYAQQLGERARQDVAVCSYERMVEGFEGACDLAIERSGRRRGRRTVDS